MGAFERTDALERLRSTRFDVVVIGGGITGAGCALDAASRGLRTALIEAGDFASGTSSMSSKLVHGGLRYLRNGDIALVRQALVERRRLMYAAPHLVSPMSFMIPIHAGDHDVVDDRLAPMLGLAMWGYDVAGLTSASSRHRRITAAQASTHAPGLRRDRLRYAYVYQDAAVDDARLTLAVARTAVIDHDAVAANGVRAVGVHHDVSGRARAVAVEVLDGVGDVVERFDVAGDAIVNATGVWADETRMLDEAAGSPTIAPARGTHIVVPAARLTTDIALVIATDDDRSVVAVPWGDHVYVGPTDVRHAGPPDDPRYSDDEIDYLLRAVNSATDAGLGTDDITAAWAGLRPLVAGAGTTRTADLSRRHVVTRSRSGVVTVTGGKLTTYRAMAADAIDEVVGHVLSAGARRHPTRSSQTRRLRLIGAGTGGPMPPGGPRNRLWRRYGTESLTIERMIEREPHLGEPVVDEMPYLAAEAVFACRFEMVRSLEDLLSRRMRVTGFDRRAGDDATTTLADLVAGDLGWDASTRDAQVLAFERHVARLDPARAHRGPDEGPR